MMIMRTRWPRPSTLHAIIGALLYIIVGQHVYYQSLLLSTGNNAGDINAAHHVIRVLMSSKASRHHDENSKTTCMRSRPPKCTDAPARFTRDGTFSNITSMPPPPATANNFYSKPITWKTYSSPHLMASSNVSLPIIGTSLPKTGTTSLWKYLMCGGIKTSHQWVTRTNQLAAATTHHDTTPHLHPPLQILTGRCMADNVAHQRPPLAGCGQYDAYTDTGYVQYSPDNGVDCYFPTVDGLVALAVAYPTATWVHLVRNAETWYQSMKRWDNGSLFVRFRLCNATNFPTGQSRKTDWLAFYDWHNQYVRQVAAVYRIKLVEVSLDDDHAKAAGQVLAHALNIPSSCWRHCRPEQKTCPTVHEASQQAQQQQQRQRASQQAHQDYLQQRAARAISMAATAVPAIS